MSDLGTPNLYTLPILRLTKVSDRPGTDFLPVNHRLAGRHVKYWRERQSGKVARWKTFRKFPLVLNADGSLWEPACLWLLDRAQAKPLQLSTLASVAQGLKDYKRFLDELSLEWDNFSDVEKYNRPTYLYKTYLQDLIDNKVIKGTTAKRRMSTVIGFYRFLQDNSRMRFEPMNKPWVESRFGFVYKDSKGFSQVKEVISTDISITAATSADASDGTIIDGGKLRPLTVDEQRCLVAALKSLDNIEYSLMHYVALFSGAREQTVLTLRSGGFLKPASSITQWPYKLQCGPGTGIDTKRDVANVYLSIPRELYQWLHVYAVSDRAKGRRAKSRVGEDGSNYLFLTNRGKPYYESKDDRNADRDSSEPMRRSSSIGQNLREFISERVIQEVRKSLPNFRYKFHDLRATFGMNWVDHVLGEDGGKEKYAWARDQLRKLMWHKQATTTDHYLEHRQNMRNVEKAHVDWSRHLVEMIGAE